MKAQKEFHENTKTYFDEEAGYYDSSRDGKFVRCMYEEIVRRAAALPGERILDLGCGNGNILRLLREVRGGECEYYGADISGQMIREAEKRLGKEARLLVADALSLPYADESFDIIICNASFHHYTEPSRAVSEIWRVLKEGGALILGDPTVPGRLFLKLFNWGLSYGNSGDYRLYGKRDILPLFRRKGFEIQGFKRLKWRAFVFQAVKPLTPGGERDKMKPDERLERGII